VYQIRNLKLVAKTNHLQNDGEEVVDDNLIAKKFNHHFTLVGKNLTENVKTPLNSSKIPFSSLIFFTIPRTP